MVALMIGLVAAIPAGARPTPRCPAGFTSTPVFSGLTLPTAMAFSPDGKVYVAEKSGVIKVFPNASSNNGVDVQGPLDPRRSTSGTAVCSA